MKKKYEQKIDPITGYPTLPWYGAVIGGFGGFILLVSLALALPYPSLAVLKITLPVGFLGGINFVWLRIKPNLHSKFFHNTLLAILFLVMSYRGFEYLVPDYAWPVGILLILTVIFAHTLPMWNYKITRFVKTELWSPKTKIGKAIFVTALAILPIIGGLAYALTKTMAQQGKGIAMSLIMGILFWFLAVIIPFSDARPSSPWEVAENSQT